MPRPVKFRRVCCLPNNNLFGPLDDANQHHQPIQLSVEEYETIRLIDFEDCTQEECAKSMQVARTTVQKSYNDARKKLAESLVNSRRLVIAGGNYKLFEEKERRVCCCKCRRNGLCKYNPDD